MRKTPVVIAASSALLLSAAAVVFSSSPPVAALRQESARLLRPMMRVADRASRTVASRARGLSFSTCGAYEEEHIRREVTEAKLAQAADENEALKKALGLKEQFGPVLAPAGVMLYNQEWDREWLIIDAGEEDGVRDGDLVIDEQQFLVGEVVETNAGSATVAVASNRGTAFNVALAPSGGEALAHGLGGRAFDLALIPRDAAVGSGDMAMRVPHINKKIPPIFAGRVARVDDRAGGAFKKGSAVLLSHPERITRVIVITAR